MSGSSRGSRAPCARRARHRPRAPTNGRIRRPTHRAIGDDRWRPRS
jgi:hypothetical protein